MRELSARDKKSNKGFWPDGTFIIKIQFSAILLYAIALVIVMFVAGIAIIIAQTIGPPPGSEEIQGDTAAEVESPDRFNDLRKQYLDARHESIDWWLTGIAIVLTFFAVAVAVFGFIGIKQFQDLRGEAMQHVDEVKRLANEADEDISEMRLHMAAIREGRKEFDQGSAQVRQEIRSLFDEPSEKIFKLLDNVRQIDDLSPSEEAVIEALTLQHQDDKVEEAIQKLKSIANVIERRDNNLAARAWKSIGYLYLESDNKEEALTAFDSAIRLKRDDAEAYAIRGTVRSLLEDYRFAIVDYGEAIRLGANLEERHTQRANARNGLKRYNEAIVDCNEAIRLNPDYAEAYAIRGEAKNGLSEGTEAKADFQRALELANGQGNEALSNQIRQRLRELFRELFREL